MRAYVSSTMFEIINKKFIYRGWNVRSDHIYHEKTPQLLLFGKTGIMLRLVDNEPKLDVPAGQEAELLQSDHAFKEGRRVDGKFIEVRIY